MSIPSPGSRLQQLGRFSRITLKELREILRDRRTILTLLLMPILIYPLLSIAFQQFLLASTKPDVQPTYRLAFRTQEEAGLFGVCLLRGLELTPRRPPPDDPTGESRRPALSVGSFSILVGEDPNHLVQQGEADLAVHLSNPEAWRDAMYSQLRPGDDPFVDFNPNQVVQLDCEIAYVHGSWYGEQARDCVERLVMTSNARIHHRRMVSQGVRDPGRVDPVSVRLQPLVADGPTASFSLTTFIPLILILMTITGAVYPAIDLTAGERERGTLEVLIAAPVSRLGLLFAKYVAVVVVAMLTALTNLGMMTLTLTVSKLGVQIFPGGLTVELVLAVLLLLLLFSAFFSALLLVVTSFARSFKEAQAYIVPLVLLTLIPGMITLLPGIQLRGLLTVAPLMNMVLLARDLFEQRAHFASASLVLLSTSLYAAAALALAAKIFGAEAVLYSEQSGWSELFHRPSEPQPAGSVGAALVSMALMFPLAYLLPRLLGPPGKTEFAGWLLLLGTFSVVTFAGVPLVAAWLGRVRFRDGFGLRMPSWTGLIGALLLGLTLWVFVHEGLQWMREQGLTSDESLRRFRTQMQLLLLRWRTVSPFLVILTVAALPALSEELFFRGYLFQALQTASGSITAIVLSSLLFGLFHLVTAMGMMSERFLVTTLLGLVLGIVRWRTGSVLPGMLLHAAHNSVLVLITLYNERLTELAWNVEKDHAPLLWVAAAAVGVSVGGSLIAWRWPAPIHPSRQAIQ